MFLVSACLAGIRCRYNGGSKPEREIVDLFKSGEVIAVCPEQLGGLTTPRPPSQFYGGTGEDVLDGKAKLIRQDGVDLTSYYIEGAYAVLRIMKELNLNKAVLKARSPACGVGTVWCENELVNGYGVCSSLLLREGYQVIAGGI